MNKLLIPLLLSLATHSSPTARASTCGVFHQPISPTKRLVYEFWYYMEVVGFAHSSLESARDAESYGTKIIKDNREALKNKTFDWYGTCGSDNCGRGWCNECPVGYRHFQLAKQDLERFKEEEAEAKRLAPFFTGVRWTKSLVSRGRNIHNNFNIQGEEIIPLSGGREGVLLTLRSTFSTSDVSLLKDRRIRRRLNNSPVELNWLTASYHSNNRDRIVIVDSTDISRIYATLNVRLELVESIQIKDDQIEITFKPDFRPGYTHRYPISQRPLILE